jgi:hypothetical protein
VATAAAAVAVTEAGKGASSLVSVELLQSDNNEEIGKRRSPFFYSISKARCASGLARSVNGSGDGCGLFFLGGSFDLAGDKLHGQQ